MTHVPYAVPFVNRRNDPNKNSPHAERQGWYMLIGFVVLSYVAAGLCIWLSYAYNDRRWIGVAVFVATVLMLANAAHPTLRRLAERGSSVREWFASQSP